MTLREVAGVRPEVRRQLDFNGQLGVVTGGTRGIGRAVALELARAGASVIAVGHHNRAAADRITEELAAIGGKHAVVLADVADRIQLSAAIDGARRGLGRPVSYLVCCAGTWQRRSVREITAEDLEAMFAVHVHGTVFAIQAVLQDMVASGYGRIVTITSSAATVGSAFGAAGYAAAKGAVIGLTKTAAKDLARDGITVNCVSPIGETEMFAEMFSSPAEREAFATRFPLGLPDPAAVASVIAFFASPGSGCATGQVISADGGMVM